MNKPLTIRAVISGRVQGVFYRLETQRAAIALQIKGWVKNLPNGDVEAVFQAEPDQVKKILDWCHNGPPNAQVTSVKDQPLSDCDPFDTFEIRY